ncbi:PAAR-like domain-containing protein [Enterovibrio norvegicus]
MAPADVCKTPPFGIPAPFPNMMNRSMSNPSTANTKVIIVSGPAATTNTIVLLSSGDEAGVMGGVASSMIIGPCRNATGSACVIHAGMPATTFIHPSMHNGMSPNTVGNGVAPSQTKVMIMR